MSTTICHQCGTEVVGEAIYCHQCGARVAQFDQEDRGLATYNPLDETAQATVENPGDYEEASKQSRASAREDLLNRRSGRDNDEAEQPLWEDTYSPKAMYPVWIVCGFATLTALLVAAVYLDNGTGWLILLLGIAAVWAICAARLIYLRLGVRYYLSTKRFRHEVGILRRKTDRMEVIDIDDVSYEQGIVDRLTGVGTIKIISSDRSHPEIVLRGIDSVKAVADQIDSVRRAERERRGLHIESI